MIRIFGYAKVVNVVDGDTCDIEIDLGFFVKVVHRFRLARIDTPERSQIGWKEATARLTSLVLSKSVVVHSEKTDKYGRFLAEIMVDGVSVNDTLLNEGFAELYK